jgi:hypothetical protein
MIIELGQKNSNHKEAEQILWFLFGFSLLYLIKN